MKTPAKAAAKAGPRSTKKNARKVPAKTRRPAAHRSARPYSRSPARILDLISGMWAARAVGAFARLGIADQLADGPRTAAELARFLGADATSLYRLMRAVVSIGVLTKGPGGRFGLTSFGQCLRSGIPGSMRAAIASEVDTVHWGCWGQLDDCIRT